MCAKLGFLVGTSPASRAGQRRLPVESHESEMNAPTLGIACMARIPEKPAGNTFAPAGKDGQLLAGLPGEGGRRV